MKVSKFSEQQIALILKQVNESALNNGSAIEVESIFGAKASFGLQGLAAEGRITLRFRVGIPSANEL